MNFGELEVFRGISEGEMMAMIRCFRMRRVTFQEGNRICTYAGGQREVGVVLSGAAELVRYDDGGTRTILERLETGSVFGQVLAFTADFGDLVEVDCAEECEILFMDYDHLMSRCENACTYHSQMVQNMFALVAEQTQQLSVRVEVLSRRSIREKLLCYLQYLSQIRGGGEIELPFSLNTLADYIGADRSAMTRELKKMQQEGMIERAGRMFMLSSPKNK